VIEGRRSTVRRGIVMGMHPIGCHIPWEGRSLKSSGCGTQAGLKPIPERHVKLIKMAKPGPPDSQGVRSLDHILATDNHKDFARSDGLRVENWLRI